MIVGYQLILPAIVDENSEYVSLYYWCNNTFTGVNIWWHVAAELVKRIEESLLSLQKKPSWKERLELFSITGFQKTSFDNYLEAIDILEATQSLSFGITYY